MTTRNCFDAIIGVWVGVFTCPDRLTIELALIWVVLMAAFFLIASRLLDLLSFIIDNKEKL